MAGPTRQQANTPPPPISEVEPCDGTQRETVLGLVSMAYEAAADAADRDLIDFSLIGAPLAQAIALLRAEP